MKKSIILLFAVLLSLLITSCHKNDTEPSQISATVSQGVIYYMYFVSGGQTITKVVFTPANGAKEMDVEIDAQTTGIASVENAKATAPIYDIYGKRITSLDALPEGSLYIRNGKKYVK